MMAGLALHAKRCKSLGLDNSTKPCHTTKHTIWSLQKKSSELNVKSGWTERERNCYFCIVNALKGKNQIQNILSWSASVPHTEKKILYLSWKTNYFLRTAFHHRFHLYPYILNSFWNLNQEYHVSSTLKISII